MIFKWISGCFCYDLMSVYYLTVSLSSWVLTVNLSISLFIMLLIIIVIVFTSGVCTIVSLSSWILINLGIILFDHAVLYIMCYLRAKAMYMFAGWLHWHACFYLRSVYHSVPQLCCKEPAAYKYRRPLLSDKACLLTHFWFQLSVTY